MGLGSVEFVTLAQAREQAFELRRKLKHEKIDPLEQRKASAVGARIAALTGATFEQVGASVHRNEVVRVARRRLSPRVAEHA